MLILPEYRLGWLAVPPKVRGPGMRRRKAPKIYVRTCRRDGIQWWVPEHILRARKPGLAERNLVSGEKWLAVGSGRASGHGFADKAARMQAEWTEAQRLYYCPYCGASDWDAQLVDHMPPALEVQIQTRAAAYHQQIQTWAPPPPPPPPAPQYWYQPPPPQPPPPGWY